MKMLKNKFYLLMNMKNKKSSEEKFYDHYFLTESKEKGLDIKQYQDPLNQSEIK